MSFLEKQLKGRNTFEVAKFDKNVSSPRVTVIVPTYYDWARLEKCVKALQNQTLSIKEFEVIIVNNAPEDAMPVGFFLPENFHIIIENKPGSYAARNAALEVARGEILAFTDSDCIPQPLWLESAMARLDNGAELLAGKVELFFKSSKLTIVEIYEKAFAFDQKKYAKVGGSATANMVTWSKHFKTVGHFNDALMSGGDVEWGRRATDKGIPIEYASEVIVLHPARSDIKTMLKKKRRVLGGEISKNKIFFKKKVFFTIVKGFFPPREALKLFLKKELTWSEKLLAYLLCYYFKAYSTAYRIALIVGLVKPQRS